MKWNHSNNNKTRFSDSSSLRSFFPKKNIDVQEELDFENSAKK
ncbi:hypothetical protein NOR51B_879 [Luminiphilus syltensis NOR5-1B]|uniref:Uncharacterized protein n=1 Tax=Luminiphilus syltensis NOR5-1B TaxID=565045 RepID=B8KW84_9GAMM|nr:hypothetical protein NOR51B_879 [Luminiphilus syltensis NOR5-1B]